MSYKHINSYNGLFFLAFIYSKLVKRIILEIN